MDISNLIAKVITFLILLVLSAPALSVADGSTPALPSGEAAQTSDDAQSVSNPFDQLRDHALSYFNPAQGSVSDVDDNTILIDLGSTDGVQQGMRFRVFRKGEPFFHPITKVLIGQAEEPVGLAEVTGTQQEAAELTVIWGELQVGDVVRISSARVRVLFHQMADVDWNLSEEYYYRLKDTDRFLLSDTSPADSPDEEIIKEAKLLNADVAIVLSTINDGETLKVTQRLLWVEEGTEISSMVVDVGDDMVRKFKLGEEYFAPDKNLPSVSFTIPYSSRLIAMGDMDGDGTDEIALSTGNVVRFYNYSASLKPALDAEEIKGKVSEQHLWLQLQDLDDDGDDELLISYLFNQTIRSELYDYKDGALTMIWHGQHYSRLIDSRVYGQHSGETGGFKGEVFLVDYKPEAETEVATEALATPKSLRLPEGIGLYDFSYIDSGHAKQKIIAYDAKNFLNLYLSDGSLLWRSEEGYGSPVRIITAEEDAQGVAKTWRVANRLLHAGDIMITSRNISVSESARGVSVKKSQIVDIYIKGNALFADASVDDLPGTVIDYAVSGDKLFVLSSSFGIKPLNIFKGRTLYTTKLYIYPIKASDNEF